MNAFSHLVAWFYGHPDLAVTKEELALLRALREGALREADLSTKLGLTRGQLNTLVEALRRKKLLGRNRTTKRGLWEALGGSTADPESVWLSIPGRKVLNGRSGHPPEP
jgi:hypothetical protein